MFGRSPKKEVKHDDDMTVWVPKGVYNSVEPLWDKRYAWHPMAVDDSLPIDQTSFIQVDETVEEPESLEAEIAGHESLAPAISPDTASIHSAVSDVGELPTITNAAQGRSAQPRKSDFGFPVRQMTWNTSRRKRDAQLQRQKSRDKYGIPKIALTPASKAAPAAKKAAPAAKASPSPNIRPTSKSAPEGLGGDFVMFAL